MDIKGSFSIKDANESPLGARSVSGAFTSSSAGKVQDADGGEDLTGSLDRVFNFTASKNWTGSTSAGTSHNHTFSSSATIGSGEYTRPNSISCLYLISY